MKYKNKVYISDPMRGYIFFKYRMFGIFKGNK